MNICKLSLITISSLVMLRAAHGQWSPFPENPILTKAPGVASLSILHPVVIPNKDGGFQMWYTGYWGTWEIGYATSDDGRKWDNHSGEAVFKVNQEQDAWDGGMVGKSWVIKDGDTYKMWYMGNTSWKSPWSIGYATSTDGIMWDRYPAPVLKPSPEGAESGGVEAPCVLKDGDLYKMWYIASAKGNFSKSVYYATSPDGINWTKHDTAVLQPNGEMENGVITSASVTREGDQYILYYCTGTNKLAVAVSDDGVNWVRDAGAAKEIATSFGETAINDFMTTREPEILGWYTIVGQDANAIGGAICAEAADPGALQKKK